jgi:hypothetical protein
LPDAQHNAKDNDAPPITFLSVTVSPSNSQRRKKTPKIGNQIQHGDNGTGRERL